MKQFIDIIKEASVMDDLERQARQRDVELNVLDRGSFIDLAWIENLTKMPGNGTRVMKMLINYADKVGKAIRLFVVGCDPQLIDFYERFGFVCDEIDEGGDQKMVRQPA